MVEHYSEGNIIALTCSDEYIKEEYLEKTREIIKEMKENKKSYDVTAPKYLKKKDKDKPSKEEKSKVSTKLGRKFYE